MFGINQGWVVRLCYSWLSSGKATWISHGKIPIGTKSHWLSFSLSITHAHRQTHTRIHRHTPSSALLRQDEHCVQHDDHKDSTSNACLCLVLFHGVITTVHLFLVFEIISSPVKVLHLKKWMKEPRYLLGTGKGQSTSPEKLDERKLVTFGWGKGSIFFVIGKKWIDHLY